LVFVLNVIVSYAFGAAITGIVNIFTIEKDVPLNATEVHVLTFMRLLFQYCISRMFYPVAGFIADVYIGRCKMVKISLVLLAVGYTMLVVAFILGGQKRVFEQSEAKAAICVDLVRMVAFLIISAGGGAFEATIIPFGVDQLQGASSAEISSYFYFFYFSRNLGMVLGVAIYSIVLYASLKMNSIEFENYLQFISDNPHINELYGVFQPLVTLIILTVGIILIICFHHWFFKNTLWENPVKLIAKILCYTATVKRHLPVRNRAFRYGEERKRRIELAKITYDGKFPDEKVEDVKAFCRIFLILLSLIPTLFSMNAFDVLLSQEANQTLTQLYNSSSLEIDLYPNTYWGVNVTAILFILPVVNFLVIPSLPKLTIRARIGIGLVLYCIAGLCVVVIHAVPLAQHTTHQRSEVSGIQLAFLLIPVLIIALAEVLTTVSVLEFIYAQSPESMKGLLSGLFYFFLGLTSIPSSALLYIYRESRENRILVRFHAGFTVIMVVGTVLYVVAAVLHRNRQRHDEDSLQQRLIIENQLHSTISA
ncbi:Solute carrier family 15 member 4, partial [Geodia barretti]